MATSYLLLLDSSFSRLHNWRLITCDSFEASSSEIFSLCRLRRIESNQMDRGETLSKQIDLLPESFLR